ncbi:G protein-coupled glucose receptor regulating Gpa2-domain-containing protein [Gigaspora rosea]|uniref:G protein-coupled glucose receptor regulating Gpa2-domain-containing protein n=1 Tax=Gigaspora rosea TaxID=44941 RepID=A0A397UU98_9GLOM|nr:G protein-coupled glucose receptor regulating Gpa2-domain-containing protein [Gigaspora rosea]
MKSLNVSFDNDDLDPNMNSNYVKGMIAICSFSTLSNIACIIMLTWIITQKHTRNTTVCHLVTNLLLSDFCQSIGFMISYYWISIGTIKVGTICDIQGFMINFGDTSSGTWTFVISFHTYMLVVHNYECPHIVFVSMLIVWTLNLMVSLAGFAIQTAGQPFYDSAGGAWCWISEDYVNYRISFHYGIMLSVATFMIIIYAIMFIVLYKRQLRMSANESKRILQSVNKKLIWYPLAYIILVTPLAIERIFDIIHYDLPFEFLIISGCILTCAGLTDSIIYGITRNVVSVKSMVSMVPKLKSITGLQSKPSISLDKMLNNTDSLDSFSATNDLASCISVTQTRQIRISIIETSTESSVFKDEMDLDEVDLNDLKA